jgi:hypothetical protein
MAIQKKFVLRYRDEDHLRFEIPVQFCDPAIANALTDKLLATEGIYRVKVYRSQKKLSIRYQETVCDFITLAKLLFQIIADLEKEAALIHQSKVIGKAKPKLRIGNKLKQSKITRWFSRKYDDTKETLQAAKILTKVGLKSQKNFFNDPEKTVIDFLNDILVLFLIRLHWDHITKEWIPKPIKYRYEWMAVFYMLFLLMRSRKPK